MLGSKIGGYGVAMIIYGFILITPFFPVMSLVENCFKEKCFKQKVEERNKATAYSELRHKFPTEYDRVNPVTERMGLKNYAKFLQGNDRLRQLTVKKNLRTESRMGKRQIKRTLRCST